MRKGITPCDQMTSHPAHQVTASDGPGDETHGPLFNGHKCDPWVAQTPNKVCGDRTVPSPQGLCGLRQGRTFHLGLVMTSLPSELLIESKGCGGRSRKGWGLRGTASMGAENDFSWLQLPLTRHPHSLSCCYRSAFN